MKKRSDSNIAEIFMIPFSDDDTQFDDNEFECDLEENIDDIYEATSSKNDQMDTDDSENDMCDNIMHYKEYAVKKSGTKKVTSYNYDAADLYSVKQNNITPSECDFMEADNYFNEDLEHRACEIIKGTTLDKYSDGRHIPVKDVATCFVKLADEYPEDMVYCFLIMAYYGKVIRYKSLLDVIPLSYREKMLTQMSSTGASMIRALYKNDACVVDIFY